ncbi:hypothetical protein niasHS_015976 [Heterodera schachtii]|uniref:Effector protein n=2 Tax=Heterodera TaxID=34509 RepID=A0ABD2HQQ3_HETSC
MFSLLLFVSLSLPYFVSTKYRSISSLPFPPFLFSVTVLLPLMLLQFATLSLAKLHYSEHFSSRPRADHLLHALQQQGGGAFHGAGAAQTHRCFSCMSPMYAELFKDSDLGKHFYEPKNFSAKCDDPMEPTGIGTVPCRGICLTLSQEFIIMGTVVGGVTKI